DVIKTLVKYGANINLQTSDEHGRYTALHLACAQCDFDTIKLLISLGASPDIANDRGELPSDMFELSKVEAKSLIDRTTGGQNIFNQYHNFYGKLPLLDRKELFDKYLMSKPSKDKKKPKK